MSSVMERGAAVAREILERRDLLGSTPLDHPLVRALLVEAFAHGAMWGFERSQHAIAITHTKYRTEMSE